VSNSIKKQVFFVWEELKKVTNKRIKHFLAEPIVLGAGISPSEYDEDGKYYYISMASIKNWNLKKKLQDWFQMNMLVNTKIKQYGKMILF